MLGRGAHQLSHTPQVDSIFNVPAGKDNLLAQGPLAAVGTDPDHQRRAGNTTAHIAVDHERQAADHFLFHHVVAAGQQPPHARGGCRIKAQGVGCLVSSSAQDPPHLFRMRHLPRQANLASRRPVMPHIARWVKPDVVVSVAGCRIDERLDQWPGQASREPVIPDRPEVAPRGYVDRYITLSDW